MDCFTACLVGWSFHCWLDAKESAGKELTGARLENEKVKKDIRFTRRLMRQLISSERQKAFEESHKAIGQAPVQFMVWILVGFAV